MFLILQISFKTWLFAFLRQIHKDLYIKNKMEKDMQFVVDIFIEINWNIDNLVILNVEHWKIIVRYSINLFKTVLVKSLYFLGTGTTN
jgi:hypothetical protein